MQHPQSVERGVPGSEGAWAIIACFRSPSECPDFDVGVWASGAGRSCGSPPGGLAAGPLLEDNVVVGEEGAAAEEMVN